MAQYCVINIMGNAFLWYLSEIHLWNIALNWVIIASCFSVQNLYFFNLKLLL